MSFPPTSLPLLLLSLFLSFFLSFSSFYQKPCLLSFVVFFYSFCLFNFTLGLFASFFFLSFSLFILSSVHCSFSSVHLFVYPTFFRSFIRLPVQFYSSFGPFILSSSFFLSFLLKQRRSATSRRWPRRCWPLVPTGHCGTATVRWLPT